MTMAGCIGGCASYQENRRQEQARLAAEARAHDRGRIMIYTGDDIPFPYRKIGALQYSEAMSGNAIQVDHINDRLRRMAVAKWGKQVDALINQGSNVSADGAQMSVWADAVVITGNCTWCRHSDQEKPAE